jgi:hypothetical protein
VNDAINDSRHSRRVVAIAAHELPERASLRLEVGDVVSVEPKASEWPAFGYVRAAHGEGWVPLRHLSAAEGPATVLEPYDTTELAVVAGEVLVVVARDDESGWLWCRDDEGEEGWVPLRSLRAIG